MSNTEFGFYKLEVWQESKKLVRLIYSDTQRFPKEETYQLTSQIRRAAVSVPLNIAEGSAKTSKKEFAKFVRIAIGSLMEVLTCLEIAKDLEYIDNTLLSARKEKIQEVYFKLIGLDKFLRGNNKNN